MFSYDSENNKSLTFPLHLEVLCNLKLKNLLQPNVEFFPLTLKTFVNKLSRFFKSVTHILSSPNLRSFWNVLSEQAGAHLISRA